MRATSKIAFVIMIAAVSAAWAAGPATGTTTTSVTFNKDVAPILNRNCASCHRPGEVAPMSLLSYKDVRPWAKDIREKVAAREMPPWFADPSHGKFANDRRLSDAEIKTVTAWVDGGMKEGDAKDLPPTPQFTTGWNIGKPDVVVTMPDEYSVPAQGVIDYQYMTVPTHFTEDHWIQAAEIRPGNRAVVHHIIVFVQDPPGAERAPMGVQLKLGGGAGANAGGERRQRRDATNRGGGERGGWMLVGTAPGDNGVVWPAETGKLVKAGSTFIFQVHYTTNGTAAKDRSSIGLIFAKHPPAYEVKTIGISNPRFQIPAGEGNYRVESAAEFTEDSILWGLFPHMHLRGKSFDYRLVYPDGHSELILSVPKYDFNWQTGYKLTKPIDVPKGSRLECVAYFDNSTANRFNPDPSKDIRWGDQTWEEMMIGFMDFSVKSQRVSKPVADE